MDRRQHRCPKCGKFLYWNTTDCPGERIYRCPGCEYHETRFAGRLTEVYFHRDGGPDNKGIAFKFDKIRLEITLPNGWTISLTKGETDYLKKFLEE